VSVQWRDVWIGAVVTALLFTLGRFLIGLYIGKSGIASGFGAAGSLIVVFVWVYYSAQIFLIGAEFTWVYAKTFGSMRALATSSEAKTPELIPATSGTQPEAPRSIQAPVTQAERRSGDSGIPGFALGMAAGLAARYVLPWLIGRLLAKRR
jgi:membrane protein